MTSVFAGCWVIINQCSIAVYLLVFLHSKLNLFFLLLFVKFPSSVFTYLLISITVIITANLFVASPSSHNFQDIKKSTWH